MAASSVLFPLAVLMVPCRRELHCAPGQVIGAANLLRAGLTWHHGVRCGLTNQPFVEGRDEGTHTSLVLPPVAPLPQPQVPALSDLEKSSREVLAVCLQSPVQVQQERHWSAQALG